VTCKDGRVWKEEKAPTRRMSVEKRVDFGLPGGDGAKDARWGFVVAQAGSPPRRRSRSGSKLTRFLRSLLSPREFFTETLKGSSQSRGPEESATSPDQLPRGN